MEQARGFGLAGFRDMSCSIKRGLMELLSFPAPSGGFRCLFTLGYSQKAEKQSVVLLT